MTRQFLPDGLHPELLRLQQVVNELVEATR